MLKKGYLYLFALLISGACNKIERIDSIGFETSIAADNLNNITTFPSSVCYNNLD
jgi:hypothetical protein